MTMLKIWSKKLLISLIIPILGASSLANAMERGSGRSRSSAQATTNVVRSGSVASIAASAAGVPKARALPAAKAPEYPRFPTYISQVKSEIEAAAMVFQKVSPEYWEKTAASTERIGKNIPACKANLEANTAMLDDFVKLFNVVMFECFQLYALILDTMMLEHLKNHAAFAHLMSLDANGKQIISGVHERWQKVLDCKVQHDTWNKLLNLMEYVYANNVLINFKTLMSEAAILLGGQRVPERSQTDRAAGQERESQKLQAGHVRAQKAQARAEEEAAQKLQDEAAALKQQAEQKRQENERTIAAMKAKHQQQQAERVRAQMAREEEAAQKLKDDEIAALSLQRELERQEHERVIAAMKAEQEREVAKQQENYQRQIELERYKRELHQRAYGPRPVGNASSATVGASSSKTQTRSAIDSGKLDRNVRLDMIERINNNLTALVKLPDSEVGRIINASSDQEIKDTISKLYPIFLKHFTGSHYATQLRSLNVMQLPKSSVMKLLGGVSEADAQLFANAVGWRLHTMSDDELQTIDAIMREILNEGHQNKQAQGARQNTVVRTAGTARSLLAASSEKRLPRVDEERQLRDDLDQVAEKGNRLLDQIDTNQQRINDFEQSYYSNNRSGVRVAFERILRTFIDGAGEPERCVAQTMSTAGGQAEVAINRFLANMERNAQEVKRLLNDLKARIASFEQRYTGSQRSEIGLRFDNVYNELMG